MENKDTQKMPYIPVKGYKWYILQDSAPYPGTGDGRYWEVSLRESYWEEPLVSATIDYNDLDDTYCDPSHDEILFLANQCLERLSGFYIPDKPITPTLEGEYFGGQELPQSTKPRTEIKTSKEGHINWKNKFLKWMRL